jgi:NAD(P)-dependent dehydrogenase (short-subunit alcohol dehydrogenase family)
MVECQGVASNQDLRTEFVYIDVASEDSVSKVIKQVADTLGRIDYCIHAAGVRLQFDGRIVVFANRSLFLRSESKWLARLQRQTLLSSTACCRSTLPEPS